MQGMSVTENTEKSSIHKFADNSAEFYVNAVLIQGANAAQKIVQLCSL